MTPERWQQIEEIFHEALELEGAECEKFIADRAGNDDELKAEVEKLLLQFEEASSFIEQPLYDSGNKALLSSLLDDDDDPMLGTVLGNYKIDRQIGRGGMGAVYEARRADGEFRLRVALKVVKRGVDTDFVLRRFRNERQILAALDHPFITRLIDGGTTPDGRPYFVMEYIDGLPLYRYADKKRLSVTERLQLFCRICEAVEYAHAKQVIHRDLKPSNIFIANDDSPRLLDFGIAKLLDPELASDTLQPTATAMRMMTVDYASPEQVRGEKVTYATDVYSLGVILYELLTGHRPYNLKSRSPHDIARAVCDDEPLLPSNALGGNNDAVTVVPVNKSATTLTGLSHLRRESPQELSELLRGNLDNIIMKALRKDPDDRYASVAAFREDVQRHLSGEALSVPHYFERRRSQAPEAASDGSKLVAVLPLSLMSPAGAENTDEVYLTVGLADAIITRLTSVRQLIVRPTSSITRYNEHHVNPFRAGMELGVDFVLDGRIRRFGDRLRISLQLLHVKNGSAIWAGQFDENLNDVLELEDAISKQVAEALIPQLTGEEKQKLAKRGTDNPQAYEAYLRGRFYWNQFTAQSFPKAIEAFEKAIEIDPEYALAYAGIADFYIWANIYGLIPVEESSRQANAAARRALEIDNQLGEAYASMALIVANEYDIAASERYHLKALELVPNYPLVHEWYSALLVSTFRFEQGMEEIRRAVELDPLSLRGKTLFVWTCYQTGDFETALAKAEEIITLDDNYPQGHLQRGYVLCEFDRGREAVAEIERGMALMPGSSLAQYYLAFALAASGRRDDAIKLAREMKAASQTAYIKPMFLGLAFAAADLLDEAFEYLAIAIEERDPWIIWFETEPKLAPLRTDPRYGELLRRRDEAAASKPVRGQKDTDPGENTSLGGGPATLAASELPTREYRTGFVRRNANRLVAAGFVLIGLIAAYSTGFLRVSFGNDSNLVLRQITLPKRSVAVLPFENVTGETGNDYLSDGISENLINQLSHSPDIRIVSRSAAFAYKTKSVDPLVAGRDLGVDAILTGSVGRRNDDYLVKTELINVADGTRLFAADFVEKSDRTFAFPMEIAGRITEALSIRADERAKAQKSYTENNEAFQLYLKGEFHRQKGTPADTKTAIEMYQRAVEIDSQYALAHLGLALAFRTAPAYGTNPPQDAYPAAKSAALKALAIDPSLGSAHVPLASIKFVWDWDFAGAEIEYKQAIALVPNNSEAHSSYGNFLVALGRADEALNELRIAQQLDPQSLTIASNIAWALYIAGRLEEAESQIRNVLERDPNHARAYLVLGEIYLERERFDQAITAFQKSRELAGDPLTDMALGHVYASANRKAEARRIAADLEAKVLRKEVSPFLPAVVYSGLDEKDKAFYWLERAYQERSNWLILIKVGRRMKNLHGDPRFDDLLKRVGF